MLSLAASGYTTDLPATEAINTAAQLTIRKKQKSTPIIQDVDDVSLLELLILSLALPCLAPAPTARVQDARARDLPRRTYD